MAAPYVSGLAGLLTSKGLSDSQVRYRIESKTINLGRPGKDGYSDTGA
jgi:hypothetical protein